MGDIDWDSFITLPDIFNNINLLSPFDYEDDDSIVNNINLCQSSCNHNDIVNTNLFLTFTKYYDYDNQFSKDSDNLSLFEDDDNSSIFEDTDNPSPLFKDGSNSLYDDNFITNSSLLTKNDNNLSTSYQYNLSVGNYFDDWPSVNRFIYNYCLEQDFEYQVFRNDKDLNDPSIIHCKSFRCLSTGTYESRKGITKTDCEWHCNFTFPKTAHKVKCTTLKNIHNHKINPAQICDIIARYQHFNKEMMQDIKFFSDYIYNAIYKLHKNINDRLDSVSFLDTLFEKMSQDLSRKHFLDIVLNDNMCKTNKFSMYLSIFMVKDNHEKFWNVANTLTFPKCEHYMSKKLYTNRFSWAKAYIPFKFNTSIQSTQSIESFNNIIKKSLNNASSLCEVKKVIDKRYEQEIRYCKLTDIKAQYKSIGLPHISSQFFQ
ncbi:25575_t:CDS:2, partial [Gigaspora margarita]